MKWEIYRSIGAQFSTSRRVLALTSTRELFYDTLHGRLQERLELDAGVAIHVEVSAEGVAHLGLVPLTAGILAQPDHVTFAAHLAHARSVVPRAREVPVVALDHLPRQAPLPA